MVRMVVGEKRFLGFLDPRSVRLIVDALPALILHDLALVIELRLRQRFGERAHPVGLEPQRQLELVRWNLLEVVGAIPAGGSVDVRTSSSSCSFEKSPVLSVAYVLRSLEHHVLEQMREAGFARLLHLRTDVIPQENGGHRRRVIDVIEHSQPVRQSFLGVIDAQLRALAPLRLLASLRSRTDGGKPQQRDRKVAESHWTSMRFGLPAAGRERRTPKIGRRKPVVYL